jgi:hypothetical protein
LNPDINRHGFFLDFQPVRLFGTWIGLNTNFL